MKVTIEIEDRQIDGALLCLEAIRQHLMIYGKGSQHKGFHRNAYTEKHIETPHGYWEYAVEEGETS